MMQVMTGVQKFFAIIWAVVGFFILGVCQILTTSVWGIVAPDFTANNSDALFFVCWATVSGMYVGVSYAVRDQFEFLEKMWVSISAATGNRRAEHRMMRWKAELQLRESWGDWIAQTNCPADIENIAEFLDEEFDVQLNDLTTWRKAGASKKSLSNKQVNDVLRAVSQKVQIAY